MKRRGTVILVEIAHARITTLGTAGNSRRVVIDESLVDLDVRIEVTGPASYLEGVHVGDRVEFDFPFVKNEPKKGGKR